MPRVFLSFVCLLTLREERKPTWKKAVKRARKASYFWVKLMSSVILYTCSDSSTCSHRSKSQKSIGHKPVLIFFFSFSILFIFLFCLVFTRQVFSTTIDFKWYKIIPLVKLKQEATMVLLVITLCTRKWTIFSYLI